MYFQCYHLIQYRNCLSLNYCNQFIDGFFFFGLGPPNGRELETLAAKRRKVEDMYQKVFQEAADLGRSKELFGLTPEEKATFDTHEAYFRAMDEAEVLGSSAEHSTADFFVNI